MGYYTLLRFSYYANIAEKISHYGLNRDSVLDITMKDFEKTIISEIRDTEKEQRQLLLLHNLSNWLGHSKRRKYARSAFFLGYWGAVIVLGVVVFWQKTTIDLWILRFVGYVILFTMIPYVAPTLWGKLKKARA